MSISRVVQTLRLSLPACPVETTSLALVDFPASQSALAKRVFAPCALRPSHVFVDLPDIVLPGRPIEFALGVTNLHEGTPAPEITPCLLRSLRVSVLVATDTGQCRNDASCTVLKETARGALRVRVLLYPSLWTGAPALAIEALKISASSVASPHLPKTLVLRFNHERSSAGSLWAAASVGDVRGLEAALAAGCSTEETQDAFIGVGRSALCEATLNSHAEAVCLLLAAGADVTPRDKEGRSVLSYAVRRHGDAAEDILKTLLAHEHIGTVINSPATMGNYTPLLLAALYENSMAVHMLLADLRVDRAARTIAGHTALDVAQSQGLISVLQAAGVPK